LQEFPRLVGFRGRDAGVLDQQVQPAKIVANALGCGGNRRQVGDVELDSEGRRADLLCRCLAFGEVPRPDEDSDAAGGKFLGDLEADALIGAGNEGDAMTRLGHLLGHWLSQRPRRTILTKAEPCSASNTEHCSVLQGVILRAWSGERSG
jgi:hypothetical protein